MPALSFSELNNTKVLPDTKVTSTGGNTVNYENKQSGGKKQKKSKGKTSKKSRKSRKSRKSGKSQKKKWFGLF
jgi:hypothetical protein